MTAHLDELQAQRLAEGSLPAAEERAAAGHAAACPACAALAESHRALLSALNGLSLPEVPPGFTEGVLARVDERARAAARDRRAALGVGLAALLALAAALIAGGHRLWIPATTELAEQLGALACAVRVGAELLPGLLVPLRLPVAAACALLTFPLLLTLPRLAAARRKAH
jgi:anti-sigma factor RsiW